MESWQLWLAALAATALFEAVTCAFRFGCGMTAREDLSWMRRLTGGFRLHHGYPGVAMVGVAFTGAFDGALESAVFIVGWGLLLSDAVHHFVVLPLTVGRTEFDLRFPEPVRAAEHAAFEAAE
ncbi:MAG TPA: hypothetical protein VGN57_19580 [Pirellulaceae bacterium]|jgi:hypothetical protein|nr:hypothetical protein [Pirellulaceae bacterium]